MNYLAHIYLSGTNDLLKIGNFMADSIKGHDYEKFDSEIKKGILLHRHIDSFTDSHPIYRQSKHRLHEKYGHYSGVIMDILYDHFLAKNWSKFSDEKLDDYANDFFTRASIPQVILIIADYSYKSAFVADLEVNTVACLTEIMVEGEFK